MNRILNVLIFILILSVQTSYAQIIPVHSSTTGIYEFMDELATLKLVNLNSAIKPFSRHFIAEKLVKVEEQRSELNIRQQKQLDFYLKEFEKELGTTTDQDNLYKRIRSFKQPHDRRADLFFYRDSFFTMWINPIGGYQFYSNQNLSFHHMWTGAEAGAYIGKNWSVYVSFRDNTITDAKMKSTELTPEMGQDNKSGPYFSDMRGGVYYSWKWGSAGFVKDHIVWGNNYNGAIIFSGRTPSFPMFKLRINPVKWFDFNYVHGWLISEVVDSNRIVDFGGGAIRKEFFPKYFATNMYSFHLWHNFTASIGNSMVYSNSNIQPAYLIPFILFKSVEHTIAASNENNAQIFIDLSSRNINHLHLYGTFYMDEFNFSNMLDPEKHSNWFAYKAGFRLWDFPIQNISLTAEFTRTNPMVYKHYFPTSTFESNQYNLGHYLRDNAQQIFISLDYLPIKNLRVKLFGLYEEKGPDYPDVRNDPLNPANGKKFMETVEWSNTSWGLKISYEIFHDARVFGELISRDIWAKDQITFDKYTASVYQRKTITYSLGANFSF
ncbi:hypothetical protein ACFLRI_00965 [Bacteroidota bacterium]